MRGKGLAHYKHIYTAHLGRIFVLQTNDGYYKQTKQGRSERNASKLLQNDARLLLL
jgi:hypothetical protein